MVHNFINNNSKLMKEWNWEKNNALDIYPENVMCGSNKKSGGNVIDVNLNGRPLQTIVTEEQIAQCAQIKL